MAFELTKNRAKKPEYPTKTTINLMTSNQQNANTARNLILFAVALVAVALFAKFAVVDVMTAAGAASSRVAAAQAQLNTLEQSNADYAELQERYATLVVNGLSDDEKALADRGALLNLLQGSVANVADLQSVNVSGNTLSLQFVNTSLEDVSHVVSALEGNDIVASVSMSSAKTDKNDDVVSTVTVQLRAPEADPDGLAAADTTASKGA